MEFNYKSQPGLKRWDRNLVQNGEPLVTVITPYYNGAEYIKQTFNCVINQTFPWFKWIIVNDGSTKQEDVEFVENLAKTDPRVVVVHKENGGISTARNFGIRLAKTKYIVSLDCDDLIEPTYLEYCWWMLEKNPEAAWAYTDSTGFQNQEYLWRVKFNPERLKTENHLTEVAFIRKQSIDEIGGYAEVAKNYNEDWYMYLRMVAAGYYPVQAQNEFLSWYRRRDDGVLSIVDKENETNDFNRKLIEAIGNDIVRPHEAVFFPNEKYNFEEPVLTEWEESVFESHKKTHVTLMTAWLEMGGADKFNLDLLAGLDKTKYEVSILTTVQSENPWLQRFRNVTPDIFNLPNFMEMKDYAEFVSYFLKSRQIDVLLVTNSYHGYYLLPWLRKNFPKLIILDYVHMEEWYWRRGGYARTSGMMSAVIEKTYVCNSATRDVMIKTFQRKPDSVEVLHIGVDSDYFKTARVRENLTYEWLSIEQKRPIVLFICRLHPQKRPFMMLEIATLVRKEIPDVAFVVVGDGAQEEELRKSVINKDLERTVYFAGAQEDVRPFYRDAKLTLVCSIKEGLSLSAYESCSMGVPVVTADVGGQKDLIDNTVGRLIPCIQDENEDFDKRRFNQMEVAQYVSAIVEILSDAKLQAEMSVRCREKIEKRFSIKKMVEKLSNEMAYMCNDATLSSKREELSNDLKKLGPLAGEILTMELQEQAVENQYNPYEEIRARNAGIKSADMSNFEKRLCRIENDNVDVKSKMDSYEEVLSRHEEVVNRHEEVVNRHEEVVNRHEEVINGYWGWLKNLTAKIEKMEQGEGLLQKLKKKLKG